MLAHSITWIFAIQMITYEQLVSFYFNCSQKQQENIILFWNFARRNVFISKCHRYSLVWIDRIKKLRFFLGATFIFYYTWFQCNTYSLFDFLFTYILFVFIGISVTVTALFITHKQLFWFNFWTFLAYKQ